MKAHVTWENLRIGTNEGITKFTGEILFDEKIGGSFHMAVGAGLPEAGGKNESSIHWDMVCDLRWVVRSVWMIRSSIRTVSSLLSFRPRINELNAVFTAEESIFHMIDHRVEKLADLLVGYSTPLKPGQKAFIYGWKQPANH